MYFKVKERILHWLFHIENNWQIGIAKRTLSTHDEKLLVDKIRWIPNPPSAYLADPFIVEHESGVDLFVEEYDLRKEKGHISCIRLTKNLEIIEWAAIIEGEDHLSFPFPFRYEGKWYLLPESGCSGQLTLYECISYPMTWIKKSILLEEPVTDPIVIEAGGGYYLIYSLLDGTENDTLYYRFSRNPFDFSQSDPILFLKQPSTTRNAGGIFLDNECLVRPSQDSTIRYGSGIRFNRLSIQKDGNLEEKFWKTIPSPSSHTLGFHTWNFSENYLVIDARKRFYKRKSLREIIQLFKKKLPKRL
jgi:hypothetical protein